ncbi:hypothetical protein [Brevundimonas sp.]|uniref:hypothetical protein n=1 Tax=Brevundimonas sp. TaxID=1871086 RepID=UPI0025F3824A|nr:hypothetical protein [Brevundimonas sp.]
MILIMSPELEAVEKFNAWLFSLPGDLAAFIILAPAGLVLLLIGWAFDRRVRFDGTGWPFGVHHGSPEDPDEAEDDDAWVKAAEDALDEAIRRRSQ